MMGVHGINRVVEDLQAENKRLRAALDRAADALEFYDNNAEARRTRAALGASG